MESSWHPAWHALGTPLAFPEAWHPLGIRLVYSWHRASIPVAIAPGPQRGNRSSIARKMDSQARRRPGFCVAYAS